MHAPIPLPSVKYLKDCFDYDPETGECHWKERPRKHFRTQRGWNIFNAQYAGTVSGNLNNRGYLSVRISGTGYLLHRVIFKMTAGLEPLEVDHINHVRTDNRIANLRAASRIINKHNLSAYKNNKSGVAGVCWHKASGKWAAQIKVACVLHYLGYFHSIEDAIAARKAAEIKYGFHPNHGQDITP